MELLDPISRPCLPENGTAPSALGSNSAKFGYSIVTCGGTKDNPARDNSRAESDCSAFDTLTGEWIRDSPMLTRRRNGAMITLPEMGLWITGGQNSTTLAMVCDQIRMIHYMAYKLLS